MKKAFDQTVREIKREVNKKVLKVPTIEQKVLDATSNEPWGPHGTLLAQIAHASTNSYEYQMIMSVIWKRMNDNGKNWRHVYKAMTVLEYLVANGSERVIDDIREHAYQIQTLSCFQYIDSKGRDQGNNVRKKSQSLVVLVHDKDRIAEVRQKAAANRDKFRSIASTGGMYRPRSYSDSEGYGGKQDEFRYGGRYGSRDYDRDGYSDRGGREWGRDDDRYRNGDSYSYAGDRYGREDRFGRDTDRDDSRHERSRSTDDYQSASRGKSSERGSDQGCDDDGQQLPRKFSEQNLATLPKYEEAVNDSRSPDEELKDVEKATSPAPKSPSPPPPGSNAGIEKNVSGSLVPPAEPTDSAFDFNPRGPFSSSPASSKTADTDLFGSFSDPSSDNTLALVPITPLTAETELHSLSFSGSTSSFPTLAQNSPSTKQVFEDPFGDSPFQVNGGPSSAGGLFSGFRSQQSLPQQFSTPDPNVDILDGLLALPAPLPAETQAALPTAVMSPYGTGTSGPVSAPTLVPATSSNFYGAGGLQPQIYGLGTVPPQTGQGTVVNSQPVTPQPPKENFQPKSTIWADTLNRGLVDLNISGPKTNPTADIGVDFEALNRKEKRLEKTSVTTASVVSNVMMGKAMGSGSGIGRAGAGSLRPPLSPVVVGSTSGWGGYGGMNMNMGMGQSMQMQRPNMPPPGPNPMAGGYNPMGGPGSYAQQPYGGIYR
ncbi:hypothetical protein MLD38_023871 [Melastoma candidum]|uniref:Uncharacterized protein n=1 Tax=Melastoma candidum TaxID=119954 RepID=A0ACB9NQN5_9MYRT|nr:hypothetical protein MLD38_023871 [Melastoma candidum]